MKKIINLPNALLGNQKNLSPESMKEIRALHGPRIFAFYSQLILAWAIIASVIALAIKLEHIAMTLAAILIIATRQNILALLMHDQSHSLGGKGKLADAIINIFATFPIGMTVEGYSRVHLAHHGHYFTDRDPDFLRKSGKDWSFPMPKTHLLKLLLSDITGFSFIGLLKGKTMKHAVVYDRPYSTSKWLSPIYYISVALLLTYFNAWVPFLIYWVAPLVFVMPLIVRLGAVTEHVYGLENGSVNDTSPLIILSWWEKLLLPNLNFTLHSYHHFYPAISFSNLPKVHAIFEKEHLINKDAIFYGYWAYLKFLQTPQAISNSDSTSQEQAQAIFSTTESKAS